MPGILAKFGQESFPTLAGALPGLMRIDDVQHSFFSLANDEGVHEGSHRFGVEDGVPARR